MKFNKLTKFFILLALLFPVSKQTNAAIITVPLNYTVDSNDDQALSLSGSLTIDTSLDGSNQRLTAFATRGANIAIPSWITNLTLTVTDSNPTNANGDLSGSFSKSDFLAIIWVPSNPGTVNFDNDLVTTNQFTDIGFKGINGMTSEGIFIQDIGDDEFTLTSTPLPIPFIGIFSFFSFIKKLKKYKHN